MSASVLQVVFADQGNFVATGTTFAGTITGVTAGSTIFAIFNGDNSKSVTCSDNVNGTYGAALDAVDDATNGDRVTTFRLKNSASGSLTVTGTYSVASNARAIAIVEVGGVLSASDPLDGHNSVLQAATTAPTVSATNATQPALIVGASVNTSGTANPGAGTGFIDNGSGWTFGGAVPALIRVESKRITSTGSQSANFTSANNDSHITAIAIFDELSSTTIVDEDAEWPIFIQAA